MSDQNTLSIDIEAQDSDKLAETLMSLQSMIERQANEVTELKHQLKAKRESLKSLFENDSELSEAINQAEKIIQQVKQVKSKIGSSIEASRLKVEIAELNEQKNEYLGSLSCNLINYFQLTNSTSFDTSEGDQWDFSINAKVKSK